MSIFRRDILSTLLLLLVGTTCSKTGTYTYVDVYVSIDRQTVPTAQLAKVASCEFQVLGAETSDATNLRCPENRVQYEIGTFQWTSGAPSGTLQFRVRIFDVNLVVLGEATSAPVAVSPGKHLQTSVLVLGVEPTTGPDGGVDAGGSADGGSDAATTTDGMSTDGGADQSGVVDAGAADGGADISSDVGASDTAPDAPTADASGTDGSADAGDTATDAAPDAPPDAPADTGGPSDTAPDGSDVLPADGSSDTGDAATTG